MWVFYIETKQTSTRMTSSNGEAKLPGSAGGAGTTWTTIPHPTVPQRPGKEDGRQSQKGLTQGNPSTQREEGRGAERGWR